MTFAIPLPTIPNASAAECETSTIRPGTYGPRSLTRTVTDRPVATFVTRKRVPNGNVGCAAVKSCVSNFSPLAVCLLLCVEAGNSLRGDLRQGRVAVPRKWGMLFRGCDTPIADECCRSMGLQRRLSTGANKCGIPGDNGRLSAGRKQRRAETDGKQSNDVPNTAPETENASGI